MASHEENRQEAFENADRSIRKETMEQIAALNSTLAEVKDELKELRQALAELSKTLIGFNLSQSQR